MNDKVNGPVEESSDDLISACVVFDITVNDNKHNIIQQRGEDGKLVDSLKYHRPFIVLPNETAYNMVVGTRGNIIISDRAEETKIGSPRRVTPLVQVDYGKVTVIPIAKNDMEEVSSVFDDLRSLNGNDIKQVFTAVQLEGLSYAETKKVVFGGTIYLHLDIHLNHITTLPADGYVIGSMNVWFMDVKGRRISSVQKIYPRPQKGLFQRMKIGLDASHKPTDEIVYRNFYCQHCGRKIATGSIAELVEAKQLKDLCDGCQELDDAFRTLHNGKDPNVERTYKISGRTSVLNNLEVLFREICIMSSVGASREIKLYVDGDGIVNIDVKREDGEELKKNCVKSGYLKRERYYGEGNETGYLTYLDLG